MLALLVTPASSLLVTQFYARLIHGLEDVGMHGPGVHATFQNTKQGALFAMHNFGGGVVSSILW